MNEYNTFDYILLFTFPIFFGYQIIKYIKLFICYFKKPIKLQALVTGITKDNPGINPFGPFSYSIEYDLKGEMFKSSVGGFGVPYYYKVGDVLNVVLHRHDPYKVIALNVRGQVVKVLVTITIFLLVIIGAAYCLHLLNFFEGEYFGRLLPFCFLALAIIMFSFTLYSKYVLNRNSISTNGVIKQFTEVVDNDNNKAYRPLIEYEYYNRTYQSESQVFYYDKSRLGKKIPIIFLVDMPQFGEIDSFENKWLHLAFWLAVLIIAIVVIVIPLRP